MFRPVPFWTGKKHLFFAYILHEVMTMPSLDVYELTTQSVSGKPISLLLTELLLEAMDLEPPHLCVDYDP